MILICALSYGLKTHAYNIRAISPPEGDIRTAITTDGATLKVNINLIVALIDTSNLVPFNILNSTQVEHAAANIKQIKALIAQYPDVEPLIEPKLGALQSDISKYESGSVKRAGVWRTEVDDTLLSLDLKTDFKNLITEKDVAKIREQLKSIADVANKHPKEAYKLQPAIQTLSDPLKKFDSGWRKVAGNWLNRQDYAAYQSKSAFDQIAPQLDQAKLRKEDALKLLEQLNVLRKNCVEANAAYNTLNSELLEAVKKKEAVSNAFQVIDKLTRSSDDKNDFTKYPPQGWLNPIRQVVGYNAADRLKYFTTNRFTQLTDEWLLIEFLEIEFNPLQTSLESKSFTEVQKHFESAREALKNLRSGKTMYFAGINKPYIDAYGSLNNSATEHPTGSNCANEIIDLGMKYVQSLLDRRQTYVNEASTLEAQGKTSRAIKSLQQANAVLFSEETTERINQLSKDTLF